MSELPTRDSKAGLKRFLSGVLALLGLGMGYWAFQPEGPESFGRYQAFGDMLMSWRVGPVAPLALLLGGYLIFEAVRMWRRAR